ncbi:MAG: glycosyltransferase [Candidatus Moranbacteria bacterium]|nr:glycosyltransferase [Candidatus Moranbacteria bacterium]
MKVAIVHDYLTKLGGAEKVLQTIHEIYPQAPIYTLLYDKKGTKNVFETGYKIRSSKLQKLPSFFRRRSRLLLSKFPRAIEEFDFSQFDLVISSSNSFAHGVITSPKTLHITYCYSPMRYSWDWAHNYLKENNIGMGPLGLYIRSIISKIRLWDYNASKRTDEWVAISKTVAKRILKYYRKQSEIIYPPADIEELLKNNKKPKDYYLIVSRLTQYKNIDLAIKTFNQLEIPLYIIGEGADEKRLKSIAKENIKFLGWKNDQERNHFLSECRAFVFPGEDDFGLTPVEAMAAGRPVIALNSGGATETVVQRKTGEFFDQIDKIDDLVKTVRKLEKNYSTYKSEVCKNQAKKFSKEVFITNFKNYIEQKYREFKNES